VNVDLEKILIDIPELRSQLVKLMKEGVSHIPLHDLLLLIKATSVVKE
jgi:hypothetical protein